MFYWKPFFWIGIAASSTVSTCTTTDEIRKTVRSASPGLQGFYGTLQWRSRPLVIVCFSTLILFFSMKKHHLRETTCRKKKYKLYSVTRIKMAVVSCVMISGFRVVTYIHEFKIRWHTYPDFQVTNRNRPFSHLSLEFPKPATLVLSSEHIQENLCAQGGDVTGRLKPNVADSNRYRNLATMMRVLAKHRGP